jgi:signal transduction histidine kinase
MLGEGSVPEDKKQQFLNSALAKSYKLEEVVDEILRASEMDSDKFEIDLRVVDLADILEQIYIDKKVLADEKGVELKFNLPKSMPKILSDERYIKHAIRNLINNSLQYTKKGSIILSINLKKDLLEIVVSDTGIGIPKKDLPKLFKKFSRAKNAVDAYTDGSGLGLFIIKKIMDAHPGGQVHIKETTINKGTTISLVLPVAK